MVAIFLPTRIFTILFDFQLIFLIFNKHEYTSWFQTMEFMESTHAKLIRALVGAWHLWYSLQYCLLDMLIFYSSWWYTWICFVFYCWDALDSHRGVLACYPGTLSSHLFFKNSMDLYVIDDHIHIWRDSWMSWYMLDLLK